MERKKIIIIGPAYPLRGGIAAFNERLAHELLTLGHDVEIFSFCLQYPKILFPGKSQTSNEPSKFKLKIHTVINSINPLNWIRVGWKIKKLNADIVISRFWIPFMGPCLGTINRFVKSNKRTEIIGLVDNIIPHEKRPGDYLLAKYFTNSCNRFVALSNQVKTDLATFSSSPSTVIPHPVYDHYGDNTTKVIACNKLNLIPSVKYILFFGFIRKYKGLDLLLNAFKDSYFKENNIHLIIAGEFYESKEEYLEIINSLSHSNQIHLFDQYISDDDVKYFFSAADLIVQPYRSATQSGISQLAYHFEKPMVVTNVGGLPEIVLNDKTGFVVDTNETAILEAIKHYFETDCYNKFLPNIQAEKQKYTWQYFAKSLFLN